MVQKLSVQIQLDGAAQIQQELAGISKAGQQCFTDIQQAAAQAGGFAKLDPTILEQKFAQLGITAPAEIKKITAAAQEAGQLEGLVLGVSNLENGAKKATAAFGLTRRELNGVRAALRQIDLGAIGGQLSALGRVGFAFGPLGIAITAVGAAAALATKSVFGFAESVNKANTEAIQLGVGIEKFDQLRLGLEKAGISAKGISSGFEQFKSSLDKINVDRVTKAIDDLEKSTVGVAAPSAALTTLEEAAKGVGKAADLARDGLRKLGIDTQTTAGLGAVATAMRKLGIDTTDVAAAFPQFIEKLRQMPDGAERSALAIEVLGKEAGAELVQALQTGGIAIDQFAAKNGLMTQQMADQAARQEQALNGLSAAWTRFGSLTISPALVTGINAVTGALQEVDDLLARHKWSSWGTAAQLALNPIPTLVQLITAALFDQFPVLQRLINSFRELIGLKAASATADAQAAAAATNLAAATTAGAAAAAAAGAMAASAGAGAAAAGANAAAAGARAAAAGSGGGGGPPGSGVFESFFDVGGGQGTARGAGGDFSQLMRDVAAGKFAAGGFLGGHGTGTSDSNLAWVSRGEHIMPARAVGQPGVLAFLEALRRSGGNLAAVLDGMGRFALGGMVPRVMPAFASGGLVGGMSNVTIQFPGLPPIGGLRASTAVVDELRKASALAQVRSGGRKPSRYA